jgi:hypothetical protein
MAQAAAVIPKGEYCYTTTGIFRDESGVPRTSIKVCPYYKGRRDKPQQNSGYCRLMKVGDFTHGRDANGNPRGTMLLWDAVKECGINPGESSDIEVAA